MHRCRLIASAGMLGVLWGLVGGLVGPAASSLGGEPSGQTGPSTTSPSKKSPGGRQVPMTITSKRMIIEQAEQRATFEGDVVLRQGDLLMRADRADVWSSQPLATLESAQERGTISKVKASGHVDVIQADRHIQADTAVYDEAKQEIELTGHLFGEENGYQVVGAKGVIYLRENRSVIEGSQVTIPATAKPPTPAGGSRPDAGQTGSAVRPHQDR